MCANLHNLIFQFIYNASSMHIKRMQFDKVSLDQADLIRSSEHLRELAPSKQFNVTLSSPGISTFYSLAQ